MQPNAKSRPARLPSTAGHSAGVLQTILVVDDSRAQRFILASYLKRQGFFVVEAASGAEALTICDTRPVDLVISDWMMPGMDGVTLCGEIRQRQFDNYLYFILLTSKNAKGEIAQGLDCGADDFLTKPIILDELRARIAAGERILRMQRELTTKNGLLSTTLAEIQSLYDALDRDLIEARKLQQSLIRERVGQFDGAEVSLLLRPCGHVGGDLVGFYRIGDDGVGLFAIDVSGHGIASAMLTARLAGYLSGTSPDHNIALQFLPDGRIGGLPPEKVAARLNGLMHDEIDTEHYFTLVLAHVTLASGAVEMVQAGHPAPLLQGADGSIREIGDGGMPIGLFSGGSWDRIEWNLQPGERLMFYSDGFSECSGADGEQLEETGVIDLMARNRDLSGSGFLEAVVWDLVSFADEREFTDDVSALLLEYRGPTPDLSKELEMATFSP